MKKKQFMENVFGNKLHITTLNKIYLLLTLLNSLFIAVISTTYEYHITFYNLTIKFFTNTVTFFYVVGGVIGSILQSLTLSFIFCLIKYLIIRIMGKKSKIIRDCNFSKLMFYFSLINLVTWIFICFVKG
jgi:hypothetical protein